MRRLTLAIGGLLSVVLVAGLALEAAAKPIVERQVAAAARACAAIDEIEIVSIGRPAVIGLVSGRVHDLHVRASGIQAGRLRIDDAQVHVDEIRGLVGSTRPQTVNVVADAVVTEQDLAGYLREIAPSVARPTLTITPTGVVVSDERVPFELEMRVRASGRQIELTPAVGDQLLWSSLGLALTFDMPAGFEVEHIALDDGQVTIAARGTVRIRANPGIACP